MRKDDKNMVFQVENVTAEDKPVETRRSLGQLM